MTIDPAVVLAAISAITAALGRAVWLIYADLKKDRDFWRDTALKSMRHTDRALDVAGETKPDA